MRPLLRLLAVLLAFTLLAVACGDDDGTDDPTPQPSPAAGTSDDDGTPDDGTGDTDATPGDGTGDGTGEPGPSPDIDVAALVGPKPGPAGTEAGPVIGLRTPVDQELSLVAIDPADGTQTDLGLLPTDLAFGAVFDVSVDGRLAYEAAIDESGEQTVLRVVETDGETRDLVEDSISAVSWSQDGSTLAYIRCEDTVCELRTVAATGGEPTVVGPFPGDLPFPRPVVLLTDDHVLTISTDPDDPFGAPATLWRVPRDGGDAEQVVRLELRAFIDFDVSPDGSTVVLSTLDTGAPTVTFIDVATGAAATLEVGPPGFSPRYSPDGMRLAYKGGANPGEELDLWVVDLTTREVTPADTDLLSTDVTTWAAPLG